MRTYSIICNKSYVEPISILEKIDEDLNGDWIYGSPFDDYIIGDACDPSCKFPDLLVGLEHVGLFLVELHGDRPRVYTAAILESDGVKSMRVYNLPPSADNRMKILNIIYNYGKC